MSRKIFRYIATIVLAAFASGCVEELDHGLRTEEHISFSASLDTDQTKAAPMNQLSGTASVTGYLNSSGASDKFSSWNMLTDVPFEFDGDHMKTVGDPISWERITQGSTSLRIFSYAPMATEGSAYSLNTSAYPPQLTYFVPENIKEQTDIVVASAAVPANHKQSIPLQFTHALTGIQFRSGFTDKITVQSITITGAANTGTYVFGTGWTDIRKPETTIFSLEFPDNGKDIQNGEMITSDSDVFMMIPQVIMEEWNAKVTMTYVKDEDTHIVSTSLSGANWKEGDMITYTLKPKSSTISASDYIYFDLEAGNVEISNNGYKGYVFVNGVVTEVSSNTHNANNRYYVYQSSRPDEIPEEFKSKAYDKTMTGYANNDDYTSKANIRVPKYAPVTYDSKAWGEYITNNTNVDAVIEAWDSKEWINYKGSGTKPSIVTAVRKVGRTHTANSIKVSGTVNVNMTIDNLYSTRQDAPDRNRQTGGIVFMPAGDASKLSINIIGDNRFGNIFYPTPSAHTHELILRGSGSLTVANVNFITKYYSDENADGYSYNYRLAVIGGNDYGSSGSEKKNEDSFGIVIEGGTIFAGSTIADNCTAIGGGGNGESSITIKGGTVTAVATTTGTAIGGGMGWNSAGGEGFVTITGGNVYAYNFGNNAKIPSSAIGGAGSRNAMGNTGNVLISGGNVYAYSEEGAAIGGGSSVNNVGGHANITIQGNATVIAETGFENASIGGGKGTTGGSAEVIIKDNPIIRTGSVGGGKANTAKGKIGSANITIGGGDIQAQFVMAAGAEIQPTFTMTGGTIRNSNVNKDDDSGYINIKEYGGAIYLEDGTVNISGNSKILNCSAAMGGAIYVTGTSNTNVNISEDVLIQNCTSNTEGGALYLHGGTVNMTGGTISGNLAKAGNGGGICIVGGNFYMPAPDDGTNTATITQNAAFNGSGGGLYVTSASGTVDVKILSGNITSNSSDRYGGGICVDINSDKNNPQSTAAANIVIGTPKTEEEPADEDPVVTKNHASLQGGGLYAKGSKANISIYSGFIRNNSISGYEANMDVANEGGMVELIDGDVPHVEVEYNNNYEYYFKKTDGVVRRVQKIVTATNSIMVVPTGVTIPAGYEIVGWNTRPDGKGESVTAGQILNLSDNLRLYAQWR